MHLIVCVVICACNAIYLGKVITIMMASPPQTHADFQQEHLSRIDNDLMQAKMVLVDITEPRRLCLDELGQRRQFVNWVKEALEGEKDQ